MIIINNFNFEGIKKKKNYFEGWFLKVTDKSKLNYSFIFGISLNKNDSHSFIQVIDGVQKRSHYFRFDINDFSYKDNEISIGKNILSSNKLIINTDELDININIKSKQLLKNRLFGNSVMNFLKYLPIPTKHEIVFMDADVTGTILYKNKTINLVGKGYMEKDLGTRFPKKWLWIQTNCFKNSDTSFVLGCADLLLNINGFFCFLIIKDYEYRFATYNFSEIKYQKKKNKIIINIKNHKYSLKIDVLYNKGYNIIAPIKNAKMIKKIEESINSSLNIKLYKHKKLIFEDKASNVSCEYLY